MKCTRYEILDDWDLFLRVGPCHCPVCGGFLKWTEDNEQVYPCSKCGTELLVIPDRDEDTNEELEWGKICPNLKT